LLGHQGAIYKLLSINEHGFISLGGDGYVVSWQYSEEANDGRLFAKDTSPIYSGLYLNNENLLFIGKMDGSISIIDLSNNKVLSSYKAHRKSVYDIVTIGDFVVSAGGDGCLTFYNISENQVEKSIQLSSAAARTLSVFNNELLVGSSDGCLYKVTRYNEIAQYPIGQSSLFKICKDDERILLGGRDCKIYEIGLDDKKVLNTIDAHMATINDIAIQNDLIITACRDKSIRVWTKEMALIQSLGPIMGGHVNSVNGLLPADDLTSIYSCSDDKSIIFWGLE
jgi:WD repeat-containing protein 61